jgi:hypothetical protein
MNERGYFYLERWHIYVIIGVVACIFAGVAFFLLGYSECEDWDCFNDRLADCSRTRFIGGSKMIFEYTIKGVMQSFVR